MKQVEKIKKEAGLNDSRNKNIILNDDFNFKDDAENYVSKLINKYNTEKLHSKD